MNPAAWIEVAYWSGWCAVGVGMLKLARGLIGESALGRARCRGCWYDLTGLEPLDGGGALRCPECGRGATPGPALLKRRRSWRGVAAGAALCLLGMQLTDAPNRAGEGLTALVPTCVLWTMFDPGRVSFSDPFDAAFVERAQKSAWFRALASA